METFYIPFLCVHLPASYSISAKSQHTSFRPATFDHSRQPWLAAAWAERALQWASPGGQAVRQCGQAPHLHLPGQQLVLGRASGTPALVLLAGRLPHLCFQWLIGLRETLASPSIQLPAGPSPEDET